MKSKIYHAFEQKINYFDDDLELFDVLRSAVIAGDLTDRGTIHVLKGLDQNRHQHLMRRQNSNGSRLLIINHLRSTIYSSYVKDVYEEVGQYLKSLLQLASENGFSSVRLIGEHSFKVDARLVMELGTWDAVCRLVADNVFQALESERSTLKLLEKIASKLALTVDHNLISAALPYLEVRHFLVHTDGKVTPEFHALHPHILLEKGYVRLNFSFVDGFRQSIKALMADYDKEVVATGLLKASAFMK